MNAQAILTSQGWRGKGHSLHPTNDSTGLAKPLMINRKDNTLGLGRKQHFSADSWWMNAFDQQLKGLDTSKDGQVVQTMSHGALNKIAPGKGKYSGLYSSFVRGGEMEGTLTPDESNSTDTTPETESRAQSVATAPTETREDKRARREARRLKKAEKRARDKTEDAKTTVADLDKSKKDKKATLETKEERRARKLAKRRRKEEKKVKQDKKG